MSEYRIPEDEPLGDEATEPDMQPGLDEDERDDRSERSTPGGDADDG